MVRQKDMDTDTFDELKMNPWSSVRVREAINWPLQLARIGQFLLIR